MKVEIIKIPLCMEIYGYQGLALDKAYTRTAFGLMDKLWETINLFGLRHKGLNIWVYESHDQIFAGVELLENLMPECDLEHKSICLFKYAYFNHIGAYGNLKQTGLDMISELSRQDYKPMDPYIEIYGHWSKDESKFGTEIIMALK